MENMRKYLPVYQRKNSDRLIRVSKKNLPACPEKTTTTKTKRRETRKRIAKLFSFLDTLFLDILLVF